MNHTDDWMRPRFVSKAGDEIELMEWASLQAKPDYSRIKRYECDHMLISTVWLGITPGIYETMAFNREGGETDWVGTDIQARFADLSDALDYHDERVAAHKAAYHAHE